MYPRAPNGGTSIWLYAAIGVALVIGLYLIWNGLMVFLSAGGNLTSPATARAASLASQTQQVVYEVATPIPLPTATPTVPCQDFQVRGSVVKAIVRQCAKMTCATLDTMLSGGTWVCVFGVDPTATDWYIVNLDPTSIFPQIAYMNRSILYPLNPTAYPSPTFTALALPTITPTIAPRVTATPSPTPKASP